MLNIGSLLYSTVESPTYLERLDVPPNVLALIKEARTTIRSWLRAELPKMLRMRGYTDVAVTPRFFTQGSVSYGTLNGPAHPSQQVDIDDGIYLPLSFVKSTGAPGRASTFFFSAIEEALTRLIVERKWKIDCTKDRCVRLEIHPQAHVDIPLYAIPDDQFVLMKRAFEARTIQSLTIDAADEDEALWANAPEDQVLVADRKCDWVKSDPRPLKKWFDEAVVQHGEQLRRVVRDVKGFRDFQWIDAGPPSLLLMAATVSVFEPVARRDDLALVQVVERLPTRLREGVQNPVDPGESLTDRLGVAGVQNAALKFDAFGLSLRRSLANDLPESACCTLVEQLGTRFPNEPRRVQVVSPESVSRASDRASIRSSDRTSNPATAARVGALAASLIAPAKPWAGR